MSFRLREINVKSVLTKSRLPEADYVINPYVGCFHGCAYCYAVFMKRFTNHRERWGSFVDVKINAPDVLEREIKSAEKGSVFLSSVTDAYHPLEKKYMITRKVLEILLEHKFPVSVLTKSDLVLRDIDLLKQFGECSVGFSFLGFRGSDVKNFEPFTSPPRKRLAAMKRLKENGLKVYAFIGPILPGITNLGEMFENFGELGVDYVFCENFNHKAGTWNSVFGIIKVKYPTLVDEYKRIFFTKNSYWDDVERHIKKLSRRFGIETRIYFHH